MLANGQSSFAYKKLLLVMRLTVFLIVFSVVAVIANTGHSQETKLSIQLKNASFRDILNSIEDHSDYYFMFNNQLVDLSKRMDIDVQNKTIEEILALLCEETGINYKIYNRQIVLSPGDQSITDYLVQQQISISGNVTDASGSPLPGVTVVVKGTTQGTVTNADGNYSLSSVPEDATLIFSFVGMLSQEVLVGQQTSINVQLRADAIGIEEVVAIGYGVMKKSNLSGAVASIKADELEKYSTSNAGQALQGKLAGVEVTSSSGKPGKGVDIKIRGTATLGDNTPLYIVDGMPDDINNVSPNNIESIEVLKDGAAAAIYGSRAANGVILITTKQGKVGTAKVQVKAYYGTEMLAKKLPLANAEQHVAIMQQAYANSGLEQFYDEPPATYGKGTDWVEELFSPAAVQNYNLTYSGGNENFVGSASVDYFNQGGIVMNTGFERILSRFNTEYKKGKIRINQTLGAFHSINKQENSNAVWRSLEMPPTVAVYDENNLGGYAGTYGPMFDIMNPVAAQSLLKNKQTVDHVQANLAFTYEVIPKLHLKLNTGVTVDNIHNFRHTAVYQMPILNNTIPRMSESRNNKIAWLVEGTLNYDFSVKKNNFKVLFGISSQNTAYRSLYGSGANMPNDNIQVLDAATEEINASGGAWEYSLASQFGRINYNFDNRYLVSLTLRRDGSSRFGEDNKHGLFPSASVAWRITEEPFFPDSDFFKDIKIRASYGELGNQEIDNYAFSASIASTTHYVLGSSQNLIFGAIQTDFATPNIKWESSISRNIGIDMALANNWIVNLDYFSNKSVDLLVRVPIPSSNGSSSNPYQNIGEILNKGFELSTSWKKIIKDFEIGVSGVVSTIKNEVITLGADKLSIWAGRPYHLADNTTLTQKGSEVASFYLIKTDGIFNSPEEITSYTYTNEAGEVTLIQPNAVPGDIRFKDANNDGKINADDRVYCGSAMPDLTYGFNFSLAYKNFDLTCFLQGVSGNKIFNGSAYSLEGLPNFTNMSTKLLDAWTSDNHSNIPRVTRKDTNGNGRTQSDRFLQNGSYLKMKNLQVGYTLPDHLQKLLYSKQARIYLSAQNLFTLTGYEGFDPDVANDGLLNRGVDNGIYPSARTFLIGVQLTF